MFLYIFLETFKKYKRKVCKFFLRKFITFGLVDGGRSKHIAFHAL